MQVNNPRPDPFHGVFGDFFSRASCPPVKKCETRKELAVWFRQFAWAARAALPVQT